MSPALKADIIERSSEMSLSISEYIEYILSRSDTTSKNERSLKAENESLKERVNTYEENPVLKKLFSDYYGKTLVAKRGNKTVNLQIDTIDEIFECVMSNLEL
jgi:hypothetical protein